MILQAQRYYGKRGKENIKFVTVCLQKVQFPNCQYAKLKMKKNLPLSNLAAILSFDKNWIPILYSIFPIFVIIQWKKTLVKQRMQQHANYQTNLRNLPNRVMMYFTLFFLEYFVSVFLCWFLVERLYKFVDKCDYAKYLSNYCQST